MIIDEMFTIERLSANALSEELIRNSFHKILLTEKGNGEIGIDYHPIPLQDNSLILAAKEQHIGISETSITGFLLQFDNSFWQRTPVSANNCKEVLFNNAIQEPLFLLSPEDFNMLKGLLAAAYDDFIQKDYSNKPDVLAAYLKIIIIKIANIYYLLNTDTGTYDNQLYHQFLSLLNTKGNATHKVEEFAKMLGVSSRKLSEVCKNKGQNAKELITQYLIGEAKKNLQFSSKSVKEIAHELHFSSPYQFSNFFKTQTNLSPNKYRDRFVKIGI